jgi:hypothetical protein
MSRLQQLTINATLAAIAAGLMAYGIRKEQWTIAGLGLALGVLTAIVVQILDQIRALHHALAKLHAQLGMSEEVDLRAVVFTPGWVLRFVLVGTARYPYTKRSRTRMLIYQGVAGRCFRTKKIEHALIEGNYHDQLVSALGFTRAAARKFRPDRKAFLCFPVQNARQSVIAVLSLDAKEDVFTAEVIKGIQRDQLPIIYQALAVQ